MLKEFRDFAMKGNVVDLAVGVIIGAAFGAIVNSLVGDIIMPIIGAITGGLDFSNYFTAAVRKGDGHAILPTPKSRARCWPGEAFLTLVAEFHDRRLRAFRGDPAMNQMKRKDARRAPPPAPTREEVLLRKSAIC